MFQSGKYFIYWYRNTGILVCTVSQLLHFSWFSAHNPATQSLSVWSTHNEEWIGLGPPRETMRIFVLFVLCCDQSIGTFCHRFAMSWIFRMCHTAAVHRSVLPPKAKYDHDQITPLVIVVIVGMKSLIGELWIWRWPNFIPSLSKILIPTESNSQSGLSGNPLSSPRLMVRYQNPFFSSQSSSLSSSSPISSTYSSLSSPSPLSSTSASSSSSSCYYHCYYNYCYYHYH